MKKGAEYRHDRITGLLDVDVGKKGQMNKKVKLKPCPFCGSDELYTGPWDGGRCVECLNCHARITIALPHEAYGTLEETVSPYLHIFTTWNRRIYEKNK